MGPIGPPATPNYAYIYNTGSQDVSVSASILFATNGPITSGIFHAPSSGSIIITVAGTYQVIFIITTTLSSQFGLFLNGVVLPDSIYGSGTTLTGPPGQVILSANVGDVLTVCNYSSVPSVANLPISAGGTQINVNASISIVQLA
jgi:hypothetical protein